MDGAAITVATVTVIAGERAPDIAQANALVKTTCITDRKTESGTLLVTHPVNGTGPGLRVTSGTTFSLIRTATSTVEPMTAGRSVRATNGRRASRAHKNGGGDRKDGPSWRAITDRGSVAVIDRTSTGEVDKEAVEAALEGVVVEAGDGGRIGKK